MVAYTDYLKCCSCGLIFYALDDDVTAIQEQDSGWWNIYCPACQCPDSEDSTWEAWAEQEELLDDDEKEEK